MERTTIMDGYSGSFEIRDTDLHENLCVSAIEFLEDTVFEKLVGNAVIKGINMATGIVTSGATYSAPRVLFGSFTEIKLASGDICCYNKTPTA
jgi:hypothetical protein